MAADRAVAHTQVQALPVHERFLQACARRSAAQRRDGLGSQATPTERLELVRAELRGALVAVDVQRDGRLTRAQLLSACARLVGSDLSTAECRELIDALSKPLADERSRVPIDALVDALAPSARGRSLQRAQPMPVGQPITYSRSRTGVFAPSAWNSHSPLGARSAAPPDAALELEFVYGYGGLANSAPNLFVSSSGEAVYYTAGLGVVYERRAHAQRFFRGHTNDIECLALDPSRSIAASGQQADAELGGRPLVCVWDVCSMRELARLVHARVNRVAAVGFSRDGGLLGSVGCSEGQPVHVWDWRSARLLFEVKSGVQPTPRAVDGVAALTSVYGLRWAPEPHAPHAFVTHGKAHLHWWSRAPQADDGSARWLKEAGIFDKGGVGDVLCVEFLPSGDLVSGSRSGAILLWRALRVVRTIRAHADALNVLQLRADGEQLLSGGARGAIMYWAIGDDGVPQSLPELTLHLPSPYRGERAPGIRALACTAGSRVVLVGTSTCDVWEVDAEPQVLISGHVADLVAVDAHPAVHSLFATAGDSARLFVWDALARAARGTHKLRAGARCLAWAPPAGALLAAGLADGSVALLDASGADGVALSERASISLRGGEASCCRFSPDGSLLAVGTRGATVEVFRVSRAGGELGGATVSVRALGVCVGHSSTVRQLDWSSDGRVLQSACQAYELLRWDGVACEQLRGDERDRRWHTWSCVVGWPVMGIWPDGYDNSDINGVDRSESGEALGGHLVAADDFGRVLLFNHPCVREDAPHLRYGGHSSHVTGVRFLRGAQRCVSIGGHDRAVFQWRVLREASREEPARAGLVQLHQ